ncbi:MAG: hypothetical protein WBG50_02165 [Desulfomonilaceae bacterium]
MKQIRNFGDARQMAFCAYCGRNTETRDHVPSKVFLDEPYPTNLPVVPSCQSCNEGFSLDEEYVACLIECARIGSVRSDDVQREKIRRILERKPALVSRLNQARRETECWEFFSVETGRVRNVILKLARGHAAFELNEPQLDDPSVVTFFPLHCMASDIREEFETPPRFSIWPEVGSRAMQRLMINELSACVWITPQPRRYRYLTSVGIGVVVRMVMSEYIACEAIWH